MKNCTKCKIEKSSEEFSLNKSTLDGKRSYCRDCANIARKKYYKENPEKEKALHKKYYNDNLEKIKVIQKKYYKKNFRKYKLNQKKWLEENPWAVTFKSIKQRCNNPNNAHYKNYGGRGIKCLITADELKQLWIRDNASLQKKPSIDRIDNDGNYEFVNCQYIEMTENLKKQHVDRKIQVRNMEKTYGHRITTKN